MKTTERFSDRVENYRRYRPGYPEEVIRLIRDTANLGEASPVADIGSGTGILTRRLLDAGWGVFAVEPNTPMRQAAEAELAARTNFHSVDGTGEATTLPDRSVEAVTCAQAFHWLDREAARAEFARILQPGGWVFLIWNERSDGGAFDRAYHAILATLGQTYEGVRNRTGEKSLDDFFRLGTYREATFPNPQRFDWDSLRGRFLSSSYVPTAADPRHAGLLADLEKAFRTHERDGFVVFAQETRVYCGSL